MYYSELTTEALHSGGEYASTLRILILNAWRDEYTLASTRKYDLFHFQFETFDYLYDIYQGSLEEWERNPTALVEARLVGAIGTSCPSPRNRDDGRLRGMPIQKGPNKDEKWDRGHYIGHAIGGKVDGNEANVFRQARSVNRGAYRKLENYCARHPGTLCFSHPIYRDHSATPCQIEFGILKPDGRLIVEILRNQIDA